MMNWDDARLFLAVVRAGQMLGAARRLHLNQATLSRRIAALERELDTPLLIRHAQGCSPTEQGRRLAEHLERAESALLGAQSAVGSGGGDGIGSDDAVAGTVRIGAPDGLGIAFLAPRLDALTTRFPQLAVQLVPVPRAFSLSEREADVAIMVGRPRANRLVVRKLTDYSVHFYASRAYLRKHGTPRSIAELVGNHDLIGYVDDLLYAPGLNYTQDILGNVRPRVEIASAIGQLEAVRAGVGIGMLHDYLANASKGLTMLLPRQGATRAYWLAYHESLRHSTRVQVVVRFLVQLLESNRSLFVVDEPGTE